MLGIIGFEDLEVNCIIGVYPSERHTPQKIYIDLKIETELERSAHSDDLRDTLDYDLVHQVIQEVANHKYNLLEALAFQVTSKLLNEMPISWVWIKIKKPSAIPQAKHTYVELEQFKAGARHEMDTGYRFSQTSRR